ncbi:ribonuclease d [hydrocarbon metagenome]|uniref:Ribonuclease d n=1 Tax=hydrocarbon metagenome TaxID=938273 RepID=A0A0W8FT75_9ZZZZ
MTAKWLLVDTPKKLQRAVNDFEQADVLSIDTEYDSFRYFREKLCLIQIHANQTTYVFDPLNNLNLSFLGRYFDNRHIVKILHAADNDIRLLKRDYKFSFRNIFDTHRAALLLGFKQLSLGKMIKEFAGVELKKSRKIQRSPWDKRPLTEEQLQYAVQDVIYLPILYEKQCLELNKRDLKDSAAEDFVRIADSNWKEKRIDRQGHTKISGYNSLNQKQKDLLKKLYVWRFHRAKDENRAVFMFLPDSNLLGIAQDIEHPEDYLSQRKMKVYGAEIQQMLKHP